MAEQDAFTTVRAKRRTAKKLNELAALKGIAMHDLLDQMLDARLDIDLIEAMELRLKELAAQTTTDTEAK